MMWTSTVLYETAKDRFTATTFDPSSTKAEALGNRDAFLRKIGGRLICASVPNDDPHIPVDPRRKQVTFAKDTQPWRPDLSLDTRAAQFETHQIDDPADFMSLAFDPKPDWPVVPPFPDGLSVPDLETFALIDAALDETMPEALAGCGLDYVSLFSGPTAEKLEDVAPYLVRLTPDAPLARALLSKDAPPAGLWSLQSGLILRSCIGLPALRRSLRAFLRLEGEEGAQPQYFRFYAASVFRSAVPAMTPQTRQKLLAGIDLAIAPGCAKGAHVMIMHKGQTLG